MLYHQYKSRIEIVKKYGELPMVTCIPGKLNQVIMNLLSNSIQAIPKKGTIFITTVYHKEQNTVEIKIKDDGLGIAEEYQDKIFDPFFTTKTVGKGTGLGLYLSYMIVEEHSGKISLKSTENEGAEFIITLPIAQM